MVYPVVARLPVSASKSDSQSADGFRTFDMRTHADALLKGEGVAIFHPRNDHWPQITGLFHLPIAVIELVEQRLAGHFKVAKIVTVPGHAHHIDVVKGNGQLDFSGKSGDR